LARSLAQFGHADALDWRASRDTRISRLNGGSERGGPKMSERAREFLAQWLEDNIVPVADEHRLRETVRLVALCREDAVAAGLAPAELRAAAGDDLIRTMLAALGEAARRSDATAAMSS
jgi:hypothetical protein